MTIKQERHNSEFHHTHGVVYCDARNCKKIGSVKGGEYDNSGKLSESDILLLSTMAREHHRKGHNLRIIIWEREE